MRPTERLEELENAFARLVTDNDEQPVIVEGARDERALRELGLEGEIIMVHTGKDLLAFSEHVAKHHQKVILLLDWDRTGGRLARRLQEVLEPLGVRCDIQHRKTIASLVSREAGCVEDLPSFFHRLEVRARPPHTGMRPPPRRERQH